jgi:hypothetical protein
MHRKNPTQSERSEPQGRRACPTTVEPGKVEEPALSLPKARSSKGDGRISDPAPTPEPWLPESKLPKLPEKYANSRFISFVRNILLTNPLFPKFYADVVLSSAPNSRESNILRPQYQKLIDKVNEKKMAHTKTCTHIKVTGLRCGSPALYGEQFCYFHQHAHRGVRKPPLSRLHPIAILEDEESIQASLMEVINALMRNTIDVKRAELILRALHIAVRNARRAKFASESHAVREIPPSTMPVGTADSAVPSPGVSGPQFDSADPEAGAEDELPAVTATPPKPLHPDPEFWERWERGGQELKRREAERQALQFIASAPVVSAGHPTSAATVARTPRPRPDEAPLRSNGTAPKPTVPAHDFKKQPDSAQAVRTPPPASSTPPTRKPSATVPQAPKERKIATPSLP